MLKWNRPKHAPDSLWRSRQRPERQLPRSVYTVHVCPECPASGALDTIVVVLAVGCALFVPPSSSSRAAQLDAALSVYFFVGGACVRRLQRP